MAKLVLSVRPNMAALYTFQAIRIRHPFTTNYSSIHTLVLGLGFSRQRGLLLNPIGNVSGSELGSCGRRRGLGRTGVRASSTYHVNESGSIDSPLIKSMEIKIKEQLNAESVIVKDAYGDGRHVSIDVISSGFEGQSAVQRQRMVYKAIWEELQNTVHAVDQMTTKTPAEAGTSK